MSADFTILLVDWDILEAENTTAESTEALLTPESTFVHEPRESLTDYDAFVLEDVAAVEASEFYGQIRGRLAEPHRAACDELYAAFFWTMDEPTGTAPLPTDILIHQFDLSLKGQAVFLTGLFSPATVQRLASLWNASRLAALAVAVNDELKETDLQDWFESTGELIDYFSQWGELAGSVAETGCGLAICSG